MFLVQKFRDRTEDGGGQYYISAQTGKPLAINRLVFARLACLALWSHCVSHVNLRKVLPECLQLKAREFLCKFGLIFVSSLVSFHATVSINLVVSCSSTSIPVQSSAASTIIFPGAAAALFSVVSGAALPLPPPLAGASVPRGLEGSFSGAGGGVTVNA